MVDGRNIEESNEKVQNGKSQANAAIAHDNGVNARENAKGLRENGSVMREAAVKIGQKKTVILLMTMKRRKQEGPHTGCFLSKGKRIFELPT